MQNTTDLGLCSNGYYQPLKPVSFLRNVHPTQAEPKDLTCPLQQDYVLFVDKEPSTLDTNMILFSLLSF